MKQSPNRYLVRHWLAAAALGASSGCADIEPVHVEAERFEAGIDDADPSQPRPCDVCISSPNDPGPGCATQLAACRDDDLCRQVTECAAPLRCFEQPTPTRANECGIGCFTTVLKGTFPGDTIARLVNLQMCAYDSCGAICRDVDASGTY